MKKIAILTITNSGLNFGNRLQNYALQEVLKESGAHVETIRSVKAIGSSKILSQIRYCIKIIIKNDKRRQNFSKFNKKHISFCSKNRIENVNEKDFADMFDGFVAGSDQVWNPNFHFNSDFEFASFAPQSKRFSYAASVGVSVIFEEQKSNFKKNISGMRRISVREEDSVDLIKQFVDNEVFVHVDPTMLLPKEVYISMEEPLKKQLPPRYMLVYFLGNIPQTYRDEIKKLAYSLELNIVELSETKKSEFYNIGPQHFIYAINHAEYICTDSFHGSVFSLLFEKQLSIFPRIGNDVEMNSRIQTLVTKFGIQDRVVFSEESLKAAKRTIDYCSVNKVLNEERKKSRDYLAKCIEEM